MIYFFHLPGKIIALESRKTLTEQDIDRLSWLFGSQEKPLNKRLKGFFIGPRKEMVSPWSTNAVEICQNMGIEGISRIEEFFVAEGPDSSYDRMLQNIYKDLDQDLFHLDHLLPPASSARFGAW